MMFGNSSPPHSDALAWGVGHLLVDGRTRQRRTRENKGHVNYDLSDATVKARAAPTTGNGCHGLVSARAQRCEKLSIFSVRAREGGSAKYTPPTRS